MIKIKFQRKTILIFFFGLSLLGLILVLLYQFFLKDYLISLKEKNSFKWGTEEINLDYTDENREETFIIKTDREDYIGLSKVEIYFLVTNLREEEEAWLKFRFAGQEDLKWVRKFNASGDQTWEDLILTSNIEYQNPKQKEIGDRDSKNQAQVKLPSGTTFFKAQIEYPVGSEEEFLIEIFGKKGGYGHLDPEIRSLWQKKAKIMINPEKLEEVDPVGEFPILLTEKDLPKDLLDENQEFHAKADGDDLRFSLDSSAKEEIPFEIVNFKLKSDDQDAEAEIWVNLPEINLAKDQNQLYVWWGNEEAEAYSKKDPFGPDFAWFNGYERVYHFNFGLENILKDSSLNNNHLEVSKNNGIEEAEGLIGKGLGLKPNGFLVLKGDDFFQNEKAGISFWVLNRDGNQDDQDEKDGQDSNQDGQDEEQDAQDEEEEKEIDTPKPAVTRETFGEVIDLRGANPGNPVSDSENPGSNSQNPGSEFVRSDNIEAVILDTNQDSQDENQDSQDEEDETETETIQTEVSQGNNNPGETILFNSPAQIDEEEADDLISVWHFNNNFKDYKENLKLVNEDDTEVEFKEDGLIKEAAEFSGDKDALLVYEAEEEEEELNFEDDFSFTAWVKPDNKFEEEQIIFQRGDLIGNFDFSIALTKKGKLKFTYFNESFIELIDASEFALEPDNWNLIGLSYHNKKNQLNFYLNGKQISSTQCPNDCEISERGSNYFIGGNNFHDNNFLGILEEVAFFDRFLSESEIKKLYLGDLYLIDKAEKQILGLNGEVLEIEKANWQKEDWNLVTLVKDKDEIKLYHNREEVQKAESQELKNKGGSIYFGNQVNQKEFLLDELRLLSISADSSRVALNYNNQLEKKAETKEEDQFLIIEDVDQIEYFNKDWGEKIKLGINRNLANDFLNQESEDLIFPLLIDETNLPEEIIEEAKEDGCDLRFSLDSKGVKKLSYEKVVWGLNQDMNRDSQDGDQDIQDIGDDKFEIWVQVPELQLKEDNHFYVWYDNDNAECLGFERSMGLNSKAQIWENNETVFHFNDVFYPKIQNQFLNQDTNQDEQDEKQDGQDEEVRPIRIAYLGDTPEESIGKIGKSLVFDGIDDFLLVEDINLDLDDYFLSFWFKGEEKDGFVFNLADKEDQDKEIKISLKDNQMVLEMQGEDFILENPKIENETWYLVGLNIDNQENKIQIFINGKLRKEIAENQVPDLKIKEPAIYFGSDQKSGYNKISYDEFRVFKNSLKPFEVSLDYLAQGEAFKVVGEGLNQDANQDDQDENQDGQDEDEDFQDGDEDGDEEESGEGEIQIIRQSIEEITQLEEGIVEEGTTEPVIKPGRINISKINGVEVGKVKSMSEVEVDKIKDVNKKEKNKDKEE
jgi:hypothetical protein